MKIETARARLLPAYPLFVKDPFFSLWSGSDKLNESDTMFWTGLTRRTFGVVRAGNKTYSFMGLVPGAEKLKQVSVRVTAFDTVYRFRSAAFDLEVTFTSPLAPDDLLTLSCPVCYLRYRLTPKTPLGHVTVALFLDEKHCYDREPMPVRGGVHTLADGTRAAFFGLKKQMPLSQSTDSSAAEWGWFYVNGQNAMILDDSAFDRFCETGEMAFSYDAARRKLVVAYDEYEDPTAPLTGLMTVAYDDVCAVNYFGDVLRDYYFEKTGRTIVGAIEDARASAERVFRHCAAFDRRLVKMAAPYGADYLLVLYAGLRQSVGAHKLTVDRKGNLLFLSKENHSNGCIATVDVSYPSIPLYLLFNPALVRAMCEPIFRFARMPVWQYDFAPHDAGTYPWCLGQVYGVRYFYEENNPAFPDPENHAIGEEKKTPYVYPPFYTFPASSDLYRLEKQMPVEECGNMLVMTAAAIRADGKTKMARENWDLLTKWVEYLIRFGLVPGNQLCTDDFAGHLDMNINLSVKAIVGIEAYAIIAEALGYADTAAEMHAKAKEYAAVWRAKCFDGEKTPLVFGGDPDATFSLKYNMAFDVLFGAGLFASDVREKETDRYIEKAARYGVPLDSRKTYTKSDWILWTTVLTSDVEKRKKIIAPIAAFLRESPSRVPFTDWYETETGAQCVFQNRSVQGGLFITLLADSGKMKK